MIRLFKSTLTPLAELRGFEPMAIAGAVRSRAIPPLAGFNVFGLSEVSSGQVGGTRAPVLIKLFGVAGKPGYHALIPSAGACRSSGPVPPRKGKPDRWHPRNRCLPHGGSR